uniref:zinc finger protein 687-like n=1 Tax=Euleptes europaea TaxID=460621 RepID=UPI002541F07E|nr:zinc finger protein 687-like [Euleptes europaea]
MGDMKTPDFDDLLAAFDIPDIDTNEAIHSGPEEAEAHIKPIPAEAVVPDHVLLHGDITTVSVIVKNTVCPEQLDPPDGRVKDGHVIGPRLLQNGFAPSEVPHSPSAGPAEAAASTNGECWTPKEKSAKGLDLFSHFSPNPSEDGAANLIDQPRECKPKEKALSVPSLSPSPTLSSAQPLDCREPAMESTGSLPPAFPPPFESCSTGGTGLPPSPPPLAPLAIKQESDADAPCRGASPLGPPKPSSVCYPTDDSARGPWSSSDTNLDSGSSSVPGVKRSPAGPPDPFFKNSPPADGSLGPSLSPKQLGGESIKEEPMEKPLQCPEDVSSGEEEENEDESTGSPSSNSSRPIKVRIKTIKTSSGSVTRTVTRVSSDSEPGAANCAPRGR